MKPANTTFRRYEGFVPKPGVTYTVQVRGVGGTTGYSDWSDPVSHMAM